MWMVDGNILHVSSVEVNTEKSLTTCLLLMGKSGSMREESPEFFIGFAQNHKTTFDGISACNARNTFCKFGSSDPQIVRKKLIIIWTFKKSGGANMGLAEIST